MFDLFQYHKYHSHTGQVQLKFPNLFYSFLLADVMDCAAYAKPCDDSIETPAAWVVLRPGARLTSDQV